MRRVDDKGFRDARWIPRSNLAQMNSSTAEQVINGCSILSKRWLSRKASSRAATRQPIELRVTILITGRVETGVPTLPSFSAIFILRFENWRRWSNIISVKKSWMKSIKISFDVRRRGKEKRKSINYNNW